MYGWMGTILRVDLSSGKIEKEPLSEELRHNYLGGRGINNRILYDEVKPGTNGLAPENRLIFGTGPLTGTMAAAGRLTVSAMSPLTQILGDANGGSHFSPELKYAGYDHVVFTGKAEKPVYLWIDNDNVELRDAKHLWGKSTEETQQIIKNDLGDPRIQITCIGPAGEKLVKFACVNAGTDGICAKCGLGAVMGSKNLKAVAVRGTKGVKVPDPAAFRALALAQQYSQTQTPTYSRRSKYGTTQTYEERDRRALLTVRNVQESGHFAGVDQIKAETLYEKYTVKNKACFGCSLHCRRWFEVKDGPYAGTKGVGVEFVNQQVWGSLLDNKYAPAMYKAVSLCDNYGLDSMECGQIIAAATEWYEKGIITKGDLDGIDLRWGNYEGFIAMVHKIASREGIGDLLAEGSVLAARRLGKGAEKCITQCKGVSRAESEQRAMIPYALGLATSTRGADHLRGSASRIGGPGQYEGIAARVYENTQSCAIADSLELCKFNTSYIGMAIDIKGMAELFSAATGIKADEEGLKIIADRIWALERAFIVREGITRKDDVLVGRFMDEPIPGGPNKGLTLDRVKWDKLLDEYYDLVGWDRQTGVPTRATLTKLGLEDVADDLERMGKLSG